MDERTAAEAIRQIIDNEVKPMVAVHRGSIDFVDLRDGVVSVRLSGACKGCALSQLTLKEGVEEMLKSRVRGIQKVEAVE